MSDLKKKAPEKKEEAFTDNELAQKVQRGNIVFFGIIIERYQGKLFAYVYRLVGNRDEAQDVVQDVFVKTLKNIKKFETDRKFSSWIYRIAHNEAINLLKRKTRKKFISWEEIVSHKDKLSGSDTEEGADKLWLKKEIQEEVAEALGRLPMKYKQALFSRFHEDKSYEEISKALRKPVNTVGTLISRAKKMLEKEILAGRQK